MTTLKETVREISKRMIEIQGPIRILDAVKWSPQIEAEFFKSRDLKSLLRSHYQQNPLAFDAASKLEELQSLRSKIERKIGDADGLGSLLCDIVDGYSLSVRMLQARGTPEFGRFSEQLWGSALTPFLSSGVSLSAYCDKFHSLLYGLGQRLFQSHHAKELSASQVVARLTERFAASEFLSQIDVRESDGIVADAAAGGSSIKIRPDALFSLKDVDILEVHEGHTHVATSLNGRSQSHAQWLGYGPARSTSTQEGLAVLMEALTLRAYPQRVKKLNDRVRAIARAEAGADAREVYSFLREAGYSEKDAYRMMMRTFRGSDGAGRAPFHKDLSYMRGFIECYNFVSACLMKNVTDPIRFLYAGKVKLEDVPVLVHHARSGLVETPRWLPPVFASLDELAGWFIFPAQLGSLHDAQLQAQYQARISCF